MPRSHRFSLICAFLCLLCAGLPSKASQAAAEPVRVGIILPLSGPVAPTGSELRKGADFAVEEINRFGGIRSLGGASLRLAYADSRGMPEVGMNEAERLILREKVSVLLGAFQSGVTLTTTEVAERYRVPYLVLVSVAPSITQRGFRWTFRATDTAEVDARVQLEYLDWVSRHTGIRPRTVALVAENSEWGETSSDITSKLLPLDYRVVLDDRYSPGNADFTALAQKLHTLRPDVIFLASYVADGILLTRAMAQQGVHPMAVLTRGAEHGDPSYREAVGDLGDFHAWLVPFHPALARRQPWMEPILADYRRRYGSEITPFAATAYANIYILKDALERAAATAPERIRDALANTHLTQGRALILPYPVIEFDANGQNPHTTLPLVQTVRGSDYIIFPRHLAATDFNPVYPVPSWDSTAQAAAAGLQGWLQIILNGLFTGGVYALFALGLSLVFGVMRVINFAHGSLLMLGMFLVYGLWRYLGLNPYLQVLVVAGVLFLLGYVVQRLLLNRLLEREPEVIEPLSPLLATLGLALVLDNAALLVVGADYLSVRAGIGKVLAVHNLVVDVPKLAVLAAAILVVLGLNALLAGTRLGLAFRAVAQDREAAALQGIDVGHTYALAFGLGSAIVGLAACLLAPLYYIHPTVGVMFLIKGYLVVVLGGMSSLPGTFLAALLVGVLEAAVAQHFSTNLADASVFLLFVFFLLFRPGGLLRRRPALV